MYGTTAELVTDGTYTINSYTIRYIKKPVDISLTGAVDCELPSHTHREIIQEAVEMALEIIENPGRYQTSNFESNKIE
jgi:hypothetical protein